MLSHPTEAMAVDNQAAVAALVGAKDIEALEAAIAAASFLDSVPGDDRQKLRGARGVAQWPLHALLISDSRPPSRTCNAGAAFMSGPLFCAAAARMRLKKMRAEAEAKSGAAAAAANTPRERSPHAKEVGGVASRQCSWEGPAAPHASVGEA